MYSALTFTTMRAVAASALVAYGGLSSFSSAAPSAGAPSLIVSPSGGNTISPQQPTSTTDKFKGMGAMTHAEQLRVLENATGTSIYRTPAHAQLITALTHHSRLLAMRTFVDSNGAHACLLRGPKGIGKTFMLREYTKVCGAAFPGVIPVYMTCYDMATRSSPLKKALCDTDRC